MATVEEEQRLMTSYADAIDAIRTLLGTLEAVPTVDKRSVALARTNFETGFLWAQSAVRGDGGAL